MMHDILVIDDEHDIRELVAGILEDEGHETRTAGDSDSALEEIHAGRPALVFLDIWLQGSRMDGLALLEVIKQEHPDLPVVMISGHGNIETAVSAIKRGAYDYVEKPFKADRLVLLAQRALEASSLKKKIKELESKTIDMPGLIGRSQAMGHLRATVDKVAGTNSRIMLLGGSGVGKELVARTIHDQSQRANGPFVIVNAAAITVERMEIELFGTEVNSEGERVVGALEEAHGGTLYIEEVADMPLKTQSKILRVLVDQKFVRVGGRSKVSVDVRILSSTARDLKKAIAASEFREDLFHRLAVVPVRVPPLAERRDDIPSLVDLFISQLAQQNGLKPRLVAEDAMAELQALDWPGNVRQLRNNIERLLILAQPDEDGIITADMLPKEIGEMLPGNNVSVQHVMSMPLREAREAFERDYLSAQLGRFGGNISKTAEYVGMERSALHRKMKSLNM